MEMAIKCLLLLSFLLKVSISALTNAATCPADPRCVPVDACDDCRKLKCDLAKRDGFRLNCPDQSPDSPLIGGNQCCDKGRVAQLKLRRKRQAYNFDNEPQRKWPNPIGYVIDSSITTDSYRLNIMNALRYIEAQTCLRFIEVTANSTTPHITYSTGSSCTAYVGRSDFVSTPITATAECLSKFGEMLYYTVQTLGMWHQSQRPDRDQYITVNRTNIEPEHSGDLSTLGSNVLVTLGLPYDLASIQHFPSKIFSSNGYFTILTNDPLYQQTIGQKVQLSFQDAKLLNLLYCPGSSCAQLPRACQNGGYQDPVVCTRCKCPDGFSGQYCDEYETGSICGGILNASLSELNITSPGYATPGYYNPQVTCAWHIEAPKGGNVRLRFVGPFGVYNDSSFSCYHWVEIRYKGRMNETGPRFCGWTTPQVQLTSEKSEVIIIFRSNLTGPPAEVRRGFQIAYLVVNATPCAYVTCQNDGRCVDGVCNCPYYASGVNCETMIASPSSKKKKVPTATLR